RLPESGKHKRQTNKRQYKTFFVREFWRIL
ncbi:putative replication protein, partial [Escherichia coli 8.2524]